MISFFAPGRRNALWSIPTESLNITPYALGLPSSASQLENVVVDVTGLSNQIVIVFLVTYSYLFLMLTSGVLCIWRSHYRRRGS